MLGKSLFCHYNKQSHSLQNLPHGLVCEPLCPPLRVRHETCRRGVLLPLAVRPSALSDST